jgi:probable F420-dependent oxidoreductase
MRLGVIFPHFEFGSDPLAIRDYAQTAEALGYTHIGADDHVVGPNPDRPGGWNGWVTHRTCIHEPLTLFAYLAGLTRTIEFSTCVLLLPQRQTVLVAKQAAEIDLLSGGRLRLGIGNGWNEIEYISLGKEFHNRGRRLDEQIALLRQLWTRDLVYFHGEFETVPDAGLNPHPVQRPIPLWFGGQSEAMLRRIARLGDGWMPLFATAAEARPALAYLQQRLALHGRALTDIGLEARLPYDCPPEDWRQRIDHWQAVGATHFSLVTTGCGLQGPQAHIQAIQKFAKELLPG